MFGLLDFKFDGWLLCFINGQQLERVDILMRRRLGWPEYQVTKCL